MACQPMHTWTFCGLVGAFLDLGIAYLLLCCSTIAFLASKFLGLFGLSLPCPCAGLFGKPNFSNPAAGHCLQQLLLSFPNDRISSVLVSIKNNFPFDSIVLRNEDCLINFKLNQQRQLENAGIEFKGEASCSSLTNGRKLQSVSQRNEGRVDLKGKLVGNQRKRCGLRRRRRGKFSSFSSSCDLLRTDETVAPWSSTPQSSNKMGSDVTTPVDFHDFQEPTMAIDLEDGIHDFRVSDAVDQKEPIDKKQRTMENLRDDEGCVFGGPEESTIRILEKALEEEQTARYALYSELEQERLAAATAADEAMAMILRLQEEKSSIEIESRQYQRIVEEKSAYDAEEMEILKEIIVRREREKHFMEKEFEAFRKMLLENEQVEGVMETEVDSSEDPMLMLQQINKSLTKSGKVLDANDCSASTSVSKQNTIVRMGLELPVRDWHEGTAGRKEGYDQNYSSVTQEQLHDDYKPVQEFQNKRMAFMNELPFSQHEEKCIDKIEVHSLHNWKDMEIEAQDIKNLSSPLFLDVHVVNDVHNSSDDESGRRRDSLHLKGANFDISRELKVPSNSVACKLEPETNRSDSDMFNALPSFSGSLNKYSELRQHSITTVDHERLKIDNEVGFLRERLKIIQEGRQKLNMTPEHREREKTELQLLENIVRQLQEIRQLTGLQKTARHSSLPLPSSKDKFGHLFHNFRNYTVMEENHVLIVDEQEFIMHGDDRL